MNKTCFDELKYLAEFYRSEKIEWQKAEMRPPICTASLLWQNFLILIRKTKLEAWGFWRAIRRVNFVWLLSPLIFHFLLALIAIFVSPNFFFAAAARPKTRSKHTSYLTNCPFCIAWGLGSDKGGKSPKSFDVVGGQTISSHITQDSWLGLVKWNFKILYIVSNKETAKKRFL